MKQRDYLDLLAHLQSNYPLEACGLLAGMEGKVSDIFPIDNILQSPIAYEMEPTQQIKSMLNIEAKGLTLLAIFHSHPHGPQTPSETDIAKAYYPEVVHLIISLRTRAKPVARGFTIIERRVNEIPFTLE